MARPSSGDGGGRGKRPVRRASGDREPRRVGAVIREASTAMSLRDGMVLGRLVLGWPQVAGDELAARSRAERLEGGTLVVSAQSGAWAARARFAAEEIRGRANGLLGRQAVASVRVVVRPART